MFRRCTATTILRNNSGGMKPPVEMENEMNGVLGHLCAHIG